MAAFDLLVYLATSGLTRSRLTTVLLVVAVAAGVGLQIPNTANLMGYTATLFEEATTRGFGDVRVEDAHEPVIEEGDALARELAGLPGVRASVPIITLPGAIGHGARQQVADVHGVDPTVAYRPYRVREGADLRPDDDGVLIGTMLAARTGARIGDRVIVRVLLPAPKLPPDADAQPTMIELEVTVRGIATGIFGASSSLVIARTHLTRVMARPHAATRVLLYTRSQAGESGV
ncbi:MAG TPA: ABC transporter permease, partial [Labilithrix sp.]